MIKKILTTALLSALVASVSLTSCVDEEKVKQRQLQDEELKAYMLGGIYYEYGYGGKGSVDRFVFANGTAKSQVMDTYRQMFILPFKTEDATGTKRVLSEDWGVKTKEDLLNIMSDLKKHGLESSFTKSWDYARLANVACLGYSAGYLNQEETTKALKDLLPQVQNEYPTWEAYFADFAVGRDKWDPTPSTDKTEFDTLAKTITQGDDNIYQMLPLHEKEQ